MDAQKSTKTINPIKIKVQMALEWTPKSAMASQLEVTLVNFPFMQSSKEQWRCTSKLESKMKATNEKMNVNIMQTESQQLVLKGITCPHLV